MLISQSEIKTVTFKYFKTNELQFMGDKRINYCWSFLFCWLEEKSIFRKKISAFDSWGPGFSCYFRLYCKLNRLEKTLRSCCQVHWIPWWNLYQSIKIKKNEEHLLKGNNLIKIDSRGRLFWLGLKMIFKKIIYFINF